MAQDTDENVAVLADLLDLYGLGCDECGGRVFGLVVLDWAPGELLAGGPVIRKARCIRCDTQLVLRD